ncbi:MAG: VCBS repeat-containing protein [Planctomycetota bacterium]
MWGVRSFVACTSVLLFGTSQASAQEERFNLLRICGDYPKSDVAYVRGTPDLDGDGFDDLLLHYAADFVSDHMPVVALISGVDGHPLWYHKGEVDHVGGALPFGEAAVADLDGDGRAMEIALGWEEVRAPGDTGQGKVDAKTVDGSRTLWTRWGYGLGWFGRHVRAVGDLDQDRCTDLMVYALDAEGGPLTEGHISILSGKDGTTLFEYRGIQGSESFGEYAAEPVHDVDRDGIPDFAIGSQKRRPNGAVWVYSGATGQVLWEWHPTESEETVGYALEGPGDLNGDGHADILLSTLTRTIAYSGADRSILWETPHLEGAIGPFQMSHLADDDGDGAPEILVSHWSRREDLPGHGWYYPGGVLVLSGRTGAVLSLIVDPRPEAEHFGRQLESVGDVNGDGLQDFAAQEDYIDFEWWLVARKSLRGAGDGVAPGPSSDSLRLVVPSSPNRVYAVLLAFTGDQGIPLAARRLPLDLDDLLLWSLAHPIWGLLDARGEAHLDFSNLPGGGTPQDTSCAAVVLDPRAPFGVKTISNCAVVTID